METRKSVRSIYWRWDTPCKQRLETGTVPSRQHVFPLGNCGAGLKHATLVAVVRRAGYQAEFCDVMVRLHRSLHGTISKFCRSVFFGAVVARTHKIYSHRRLSRTDMVVGCREKRDNQNRTRHPASRQRTARIPHPHIHTARTSFQPQCAKKHRRGKHTLLSSLGRRNRCNHGPWQP